MKNKLNKVGKFMARIIDTQKVSPLAAAVIVAVAVAIMTLLSLMAIPVCAIAACVYFGVQKLNEKNDTIKRTDRAYEDAQNLVDIKRLFTDAIIYVNQSDSQKISTLLKYALSVESFRTEKNVCMFRMEFPLDVFGSLQFGSWDDLKSEIQHGLDIFGRDPRYNIPPYVDYVGIIENTVRLYSFSKTDRHAIIELFLVNNSESYRLYKEMEGKKDE